MPTGRPTPDIVQAFVDAVTRVLRTGFGEAATLSALQLSRTIDPPPSVAIAIELSGSLRGPVTWVFSRELAQCIATRLTMVEDASPELVLAAAAELSNMLAGNATGPLEDAGYHVDITPPIIYDALSPRALRDDTLVATVASQHGTVRVYLGVEVAT